MFFVSGLCACASSHIQRATDIEIDSQMGFEHSYFIRKKADGQNDDKIMASQLRLMSGREPNVTVSWPGGNAGVFIEFKSSVDIANMQVLGPVTPIVTSDGARGVRALIRADHADHRVFEITRVAAGSMRELRDIRNKVPMPFFALTTFQLKNGQLVAERESIDHVSRFRLSLKPVHIKTIKKKGDHSWLLVPYDNQPIDFELEAITTEPPLTPVPIEQLVSADVLRRTNSHDLAEFSYLVYEESVLAGADNYLTMFGRDNQFLLSIGQDGLLPKTFEIVFASQLEAMNSNGDLAHEPIVGEFAAIMNFNNHKKPDRKTLYDYMMIDTRFLLAMNVNTYLHKVDSHHAKEFFARHTSQGLTYKDALFKNLKFVVESAKPFATHPSWQNLISIKKGVAVGQWRDSNEGLGGGRYPYDVNVADVPAALAAVVELSKEFTDQKFKDLALKAQRYYTVWNDKAWPYFEVTVAEKKAREDVTDYATDLHLPPPSWRRPGSSKVKFPGIALDKTGQPVSIMHSDGGFLLLYSRDIPDDRVLEIVKTATSAFPRGLYSPIGMFISNGAYAPSYMQKTWNFNGYHQLVVWPWQEYLMTKGIDNQLQRQDLKLETRRELKRAELALWKLIYKTASYSGIELYGADAHNGELEPSAYGQNEENKTSSAIIQGWSKLVLFVQPPQRVLQLIGNPPEPSEKARYFYTNNSNQPQLTDPNNRALRQPAGNLSPHF